MTSSRSAASVAVVTRNEPSRVKVVLLASKVAVTPHSFSRFCFRSRQAANAQPTAWLRRSPWKRQCKKNKVIKPVMNRVKTHYKDLMKHIKDIICPKYFIGSVSSLQTCTEHQLWFNSIAGWVLTESLMAIKQWQIQRRVVPSLQM